MTNLVKMPQPGNGAPLQGRRNGVPAELKPFPFSWAFPDASRVDLCGNIVPSLLILKPRQTRCVTCLVLKGRLVLLALAIDSLPMVAMWQVGESWH